MTTPGTAGLPVLTYHAIGPGRSPTETSRGLFVETLDALQGAGLRAVDLADWVARGRPDEPSGFAVVFDDGLRSILDVADDLKYRHIPTTVFLVTDRVGGDNRWPGQPGYVPAERLLDWPEIADLAARGFQFNAHGRTHALLDRCPPEHLADELRGSRDAIEQRLGRACPLLAYPDGASSRHARVAAAGLFSAAFGTRLDYATADQDAFDLARIDAHYLKNRSNLDALVSGEWRGWLRVRRVLRGLRRGARVLSPAGVGR